MTFPPAALLRALLMLAVLVLPARALACACCDGYTVVRAVGWSADGQAVLLDNHVHVGCETTRAIAGLRRGDQSGACFVPAGKAEVECPRRPMGKVREPSDRPADYAGPARIVYADHLRADLRNATRENHSIQSLAIHVFAGGAWRPLYKAEVLGKYPGGENEDAPPIPTDQGGHHFASVAALPTPDGKQALLLVWDHESMPGIGHYSTSTVWVDLPESVGSGAGLPSRFEELPRHEVKDKKPLHDPGQLVPAGARFAVPALVRGTPDPAARVQLNDLALGKHRKGNFAEAAGFFAAAVAREPQNATSRYNLACAYARLGMPETALWQLSLLERPDCPDCVARLARARTDEDLVSLRGRPTFHALVCQGGKDCFSPPAVPSTIAASPSTAASAPAPAGTAVRAPPPARGFCTVRAGSVYASRPEAMGVIVFALSALLGRGARRTARRAKGRAR